MGVSPPPLGMGSGVGISLPSLGERLRVLAHASEQSSSGRASLGNEVGGGYHVLLSFCQIKRMGILSFCQVYAPKGAKE